MAGTRRQMEMHTLYCINCGKPGIPVWRKTSSQRESLHRKALYCTNCRTIVNHIEIRTAEEKERFIQDFENGRFREEAAESINYRKKLQAE